MKAAGFGAKSALDMNRYVVNIDHLGAGAVKLRFGDQTVKEPFLAWRDVLALWKSEGSFSSFFSKTLAAIPFEAFFWETPPLTSQSLDLPFECIVISAHALARQQADPAPFATQFRAEAPVGDVVVFENLGGDADLVVPYDLGAGADYAHLAVFLRTASPAQIQMIWRTVAETAETWLARAERLWISTAGLGVSWLHLRIDSRPKYYRHEPYRTCF
jgi:hypothetical protein